MTVENGTVTGPGVPNAKDSGKFLENDTVSIKPYETKGNSGEVIPFKGWTSSDVTLTSPTTTASNSFTVPDKDVTVTAKHNPFVGKPVFTRTDGSNGTISFETKVKPNPAQEYFRLVKDGDEGNLSSYKLMIPSTVSTGSPYAYSYTVSSSKVPAGDYYVAENLNGDYYLSDKFTVSYTAAPVSSAAVDDVTIDGTDIPGAVNSTYKIVTEDISKTITVAISSSVESGTIVSPATATVGKADTPSAPTGLSGITGQPLSTVTLPGGWAWVDDTTVMSAAGTQTFKANYTDATGNYENATNVDVTVEVIDKTNVSASITFADGKLTYNGAGQAYETASISGITAGANPGWTYAYVPSGTGSLDASGKPQNAGTYTVTATYEDDDNYGTKSAVLEIKKAETK